MSTSRRWRGSSAIAGASSQPRAGSDHALSGRETAAGHGQEGAAVLPPVGRRRRGCGRGRQRIMCCSARRRTRRDVGHGPGHRCCAISSRRRAPPPRAAVPRRAGASVANIWREVGGRAEDVDDHLRRPYGDRGAGALPARGRAGRPIGLVAAPASAWRQDLREDDSAWMARARRAAPAGCTLATRSSRRAGRRAHGRRAGRPDMLFGGVVAYADEGRAGGPRHAEKERCCASTAPSRRMRARDGDGAGGRSGRRRGSRMGSPGRARTRGAGRPRLRLRDLGDDVEAAEHRFRDGIATTSASGP